MAGETTSESFGAGQTASNDENVRNDRVDVTIDKNDLTSNAVTLKASAYDDKGNVKDEVYDDQGRVKLAYIDSSDTKDVRQDTHEKVTGEPVFDENKAAESNRLDAAESGASQEEANRLEAEKAANQNS